MKHRESRVVGAICLALAVLFLVLGDYVLMLPLAVYGVLCFAIPDKLLPTREQLEAAHRRRGRKKRRPAGDLIPWYQSPVVVGCGIALLIFLYYILI